MNKLKIFRVIVCMLNRHYGIVYSRANLYVNLTTKFSNQNETLELDFSKPQACNSY